MTDAERIASLTNALEVIAKFQREGNNTMAAVVTQVTLDVLAK